MSDKQSKSEYTRYLKKFNLIETDTELPIQGQVQDPEALYIFIKDLHDEQVPKIIAVYLDSNNLFLGHQVFLGMTSDTFETQHLYHYYNLFLAKRYILILNHPSGDPTPSDADLELMRNLQIESRILSFEPSFADFIIVGGNSYFSMATNDGTACRCGHQVYISQA